MIKKIKSEIASLESELKNADNISKMQKIEKRLQILYEVLVILKSQIAEKNLGLQKV
jgi:hypothetical protein